MRFLRENKFLVALLASLPLTMYYLDQDVVAWFRYLRKDPAWLGAFTAVDATVNFLSHGLTMAAIALTVLFIGRFRSRTLFETGRSLLVSFAASGVTVQLLKHLIGRARPRMTDAILFIGPTLKRGYDSFPSGHATVVFCFAYTLSHHFPRLRFFFYLCAVIAGLERISNTAHFVSDVIAGCLLGIVTGRIVVGYLLPALQKAWPAACGKAVDA